LPIITYIDLPSYKSC